MVEFFNCFQVPVGRDEEFMGLWTEVNDYLSAKPGYVGHRLHRSVSDQATYRFINHASWQSADHWRAAHDQGFRELVGRPEWSPFPSTPAIYDVVHVGAGDESPGR